MVSKRNTLYYYTQQVLACCANILITGSVFQVFLLKSGFTETTVSVYISVMQAVQVLAMILLSKKMEAIENIFQLTATTYFIQLLLFAFMLFYSIKYHAPIEQKYIVIFGVSLLASVYQGINSVLGYKIPYLIMDMKNYGRISGISGVLIGIFGVLFSGTLSYFLASYSYFYIISIFSIIGIIFFLVTGIVVRNFRQINLEETKNSSPKVNLFRYKPFQKLIIPNIMRGISNGIFVLLATIGYGEKILDNVGTSLMVTLAQISTIIGCLLYSISAGKIKEGKTVVISSIAFCILCPFLVSSRNQNIFLIVYTLVYLLYTFVNYAIPVLIARNIDYQYIGQYSAWRVAIHFGGTAIGNAFVPIMLKHIGSMGTVVICGLMLLVCGIGYYQFEKTN